MKRVGTHHLAILDQDALLDADMVLGGLDGSLAVIAREFDHDFGW